MVPLKYLIVALAIALASGLAAYVLYRSLTAQPRYGWEDAVELRRMLASGRASLPFKVSLGQATVSVTVTLDGRAYTLTLPRVLLCFPAKGAPGTPQAPFEENLTLLWGAWGNGTHACAASFIEVSDDGSTLTLRYVTLPASTPKSLSSVCLSLTSKPAFSWSSTTGGSIAYKGVKVYEWSGRRVVQAVRVEVVPCGG